MTEKQRLHLERLRVLHTGKKRSPETCSRISVANKGKAAWNVGVPHSEETRRKISAANTGKPSHNKGRPMSDSAKAKLSLKLTGRKRAPEQIAKTALANTGRKNSDECKARMSAARKRFWTPERRVAMSEGSKGNKSSQWKGGISAETVKIRNSFSYRRWRQNCFVRDEFTCQKCGAVGGKLNAHHKKPFYALLEEAREYRPLFSVFDAAMAYLPMWDLSNGETLCGKCHDEIPKRR